ncbi:MAG: polysaccharide biosynthesis/export family protein [Cellvibrionaceae bacterium]
MFIKNSFHLKILSFLFVLSTSFFSVVANAQEGLSEYTLGAGDVVKVQVFGQDSLSTEAALSDAGTISYPFLGELNVSGMTVGELEAMITKGLDGDYLLNPKVTVSMVSYRSVYIEGEVVSPGSFPFQPGLTVRKVISLASGFTDLASRRKIYVMSENDPEKKFKKVDLDATVNPGDVITVKESFF